MLTAAIFGGVITEYSEPRYAFFIYALVGMAVTFQSFQMSNNLEKIVEDEDHPENEFAEKETFTQRFKKDF